MKKLGFFTFLLALSFTWMFAQTYTVTVSGTVTETGTGLPIPNHLVHVTVDSNLFGFNYYNSVLTNAAGVYTDAIPVPGNMSQGTGYTGTRDCTPAGYHTNMFSFFPGNNNISGLDFSICTNSGSTCQADFSSYNTPGTTSFSFSDMSSGAGVAITSWAWDFGDGSTSTQQNPSHTYNMTGNILVCLTIGTANGCSSVFCDSVNVGGGSTINCNASLSSSNSPSGVTTFSASGSGTGSVIGYFYDFGDGNTLYSTNANENHTYAASGTYTACVFVDFSDSCRASACTNVTVGGSGNTCQAGFFWYPDSSGQYSIIVVNTSIGSNLAYSWSFGDGTGSTQAYPQHTYAGAGTYVVCVTVTQQNPSCTSTYCDSLVVVNKVNAPFTINVVANGATANDAQLNPSNEVNIFPNPAHNLVKVGLNLNQSENVNVQIFDLSGKMVAEVNAGELAAGSHELRVNTEELPTGMYMARVIAGEKASTHKIMIAK